MGFGHKQNIISHQSISSKSSAIFGTKKYPGSQLVKHVRKSMISSVRGAPRQKTLLVTFDAFSTLFHPRRPVPEQYASIAHSYGLSSSLVTPSRLDAAFRVAFKAQNKRLPNYGREEALRGWYGGPRQWWGDVVRESFMRLVQGKDGNDDSRLQAQISLALSKGMVEEVVDRSASREGYALYDDVTPLFQRLRTWRMDGPKRGAARPFDRIIVGVVSNSDDRISAVLESLGLNVGAVRADQDKRSMELPGFEERRDKTTPSRGSLRVQENSNIDMIITSYEAGGEKPDKLIFDVAKRQAHRFVCGSDDAMSPAEQACMVTKHLDSSDWVCMHVGDDYEKDYRGAINAGWSSRLLLREPPNLDHQPGSPQDAAVIQTLDELIPELEKDIEIHE